MAYLCYHESMTQTEISHELQQLTDLSAFARRYRLPLRTLQRVKAAGGSQQASPYQGNETTLRLISLALKKHERQTK